MGYINTQLCLSAVSGIKTRSVFHLPPSTSNPCPLSPVTYLLSPEYGEIFAENCRLLAPCPLNFNSGASFLQKLELFHPTLRNNFFLLCQSN